MRKIFIVAGICAVALITGLSNKQLNAQVVINEVLASNKTTIKAPNDKYADCIELYNTSSAEVSLKGYSLTDDVTLLTKWKFPDVKIPAKGYLVVWADKNKEKPKEGLYTEFKLAAEGELVAFVSPKGAIIDKISFTAQKSDISIARIPNATGEFKSGKPTIGKVNK